VSWDDYASPGFWDELMTSDGPRASSAAVVSYLSSLTTAELQERQEAADLAIRTMGVTFTVHSEAGNIDRSWPFDIIPRVISTQELEQVSVGLIQRLTALNLFIDDLYGEGRVLKDGIIPAEVIHGSPNFRRECIDARPPLGVWAHICGSDLVRDKDGTLYVLEDNLRVPSGVSYMLENRQVTKRVFTEAFRDLDILPVDSYPNRLFELLASLSRRQGEAPMVVVLTPGIYNSAYFEHSFLAQQMGVPLVEGADLVVESDDCVYLRTIAGLHRVDVIYRRVDDLFLDPEVFRPDSTLGVAGLMRAWHAGNVAIANAPGAGVADDKVVYAFVPALIRYYLGEDALLPASRRFSATTTSSAAMSWPTSTTWWSSRPTNPVATASLSGRTPPRPRRKRCAGGSSPIRADGSPNPSSACRPVPPCAMGASNPGISTCAPLSCRVSAPT
jgi:uncharacterized circularly permuted ATP-grasp superfamily protein